MSVVSNKLLISDAKRIAGFSSENPRKSKASFCYLNLTDLRISGPFELTISLSRFPKITVGSLARDRPVNSLLETLFETAA